MIDQKFQEYLNIVARRKFVENEKYPSTIPYDRYMELSRDLLKKEMELTEEIAKELGRGNYWQLNDNEILVINEIDDGYGSELRVLKRKNL